MLDLCGVTDSAADIAEEHFVAKIEDVIQWNPDAILMWNITDGYLLVCNPMLNGLCSSNSNVKAFWDSIPHEKEVPSPDELIIYIAEIV